MTMDIGIDARTRVKQAVGCDGQTWRERFLENVFARCFGGLVYAQIWEDPDVDMEALAITPDSHVVAIASGGCNVMSYLTAARPRITAVDLNPAHVALGRLKIAGAQYLANWDDFYRFFGQANAAQNDEIYTASGCVRISTPRPGPIGTNACRRRSAAAAPLISAAMSIVTACLAALSACRMSSCAPMASIRADSCKARTLQEQRDYFDTTLSPLFDKPLIRWLTSFRTSLYGLGIPPAQYESLASGRRRRYRRGVAATAGASDLRLSVSPTIISPGRPSAAPMARATAAPLPPYLQREQFETVRANANRVEVLNRSVTEYLQSCPAGSRDRYVLLDAQDWMTDAQLNDLWAEITRTARPGARVIFRTAAGRPVAGPGQ